MTLQIFTWVRCFKKRRFLTCRSHFSKTTINWAVPLPIGSHQPFLVGDPLQTFLCHLVRRGQPQTTNCMKLFLKICQVSSKGKLCSRSICNNSKAMIHWLPFSHALMPAEKPRKLGNTTPAGRMNGQVRPNKMEVDRWMEDDCSVSIGVIF